MATFSIAATSATFHALVQGTRQEAGDLQRLTLAVYIDNPLEWTKLLSLVTTKYHLHSPLGTNVVIDIVRGPGVGTLVINDLGTGTAILTDLQRNTYVRANTSQTVGSANFLLTGGTF